MAIIRRTVAFLLLVAAASCIDPYIPNLKNYRSLLVVEGLITNENISHKIKLSRTTTRQDDVPEPVTDATVNIIDGDGLKTELENKGGGFYLTDSTSFTGIEGQKYTLQIFTGDGKEYRSEQCPMLPVAGIDSIYYQLGEEISGSQGEAFTGLKILLNSSDATGLNQYFRWTYDEVWKTELPNPKQYDYVKIRDTLFTFPDVPVIHNKCWKESKSTEITASSITKSGLPYIYNQEINFIAPKKSDRLSLQYSILVKQYSVSKKEFDFWNNLKTVSEAGGDIFDSQPYTVMSNIYNVNDTSEMVLGYFEVSSVMERRIYITAKELDPLGLPHFDDNCDLIYKSPSDWPNKPKPSWDDIYHLYVDGGKYVFVLPVLFPGIIPEGQVSMRNIEEFVFSPIDCSICSYPGSTVKPDFWVDL